jgi:hypothetical protein
MLPSNQWTFQNPFPYDVLAGNGLQEIFTFSSPTENTATIDYLTTWERRYDLAYYLLGYGVYGIRPIQHPSRIDLFARRAVITGIKGLGFDGSWMAYEFAKLNVTYQPQPSGQPGNDNTTALITVDSDATSEYMTIPGREYKWDAPGDPLDGKPLSEQVHKLMPKKTHKVSVHQWASPPFTAMDAALGKINTASVRWIGRTIAAKCLLFDNYHETVDIPVFGLPTMKVDMTLLERPQSWNKFLGPDGALHDTTPTGYSTAAFSGIFP